uniref:NADH-ubiquinone oxidoreductase chain 2 n=1 Tax=Lepidostoma longipilosum TaxID=2904889 RepID=A0A9E8RTM9_9NEOP|nr:NADH dehydrogenase subunit 2 [Lepidostoma longipilosum]UZZ43636.1 NADH dehydrogenase subunit 2 [Lepidostoma longipilosum]
MFNLNMSKLLFLLIMFMSTLFSISSISFFNLWMGMEINLIAFIPLMMNLNNNLNTESMMKYFITQSLGSVNFIFSSMLLISFNKWFIFNIFINSLILKIMNLALFLKMGAAPFHFWFPKVMKGINWNSCLILSTWQKIIPMITLSYCLNNKLSYIFIIFSAIIGSIMGLNQTSLKLILSYSSISHISWMISSLLINLNLWTIYFTLYSILNFILMVNFQLMNLNHMNQFFFLKSNLNLNFFMFLSFLSLGGLPPFLGFLPKWLLINNLIFLNFNFLTMILIFSSLINLFFYVRMFYSFMILNFFEMKYSSFSNFNFSNNILLKLNYFSIFGLILIFSFL